MKYNLVLRSRPSAQEPIPARHDQIMSELAKLPSPWGLVSNPWPRAEEPGGEYIRAIVLKNSFGRSINFAATYRNRAALKDEAISDDVLDFEFNVKKVDYPQLLESALPRYIEITRAYRADIMPYEYRLQEAAQMRLIEKRRNVYNISPVNYFDSEISRRAFGLSPQQLLQRLEGKIAEGRMLGDGAYIVATREIVDADQARQIDAQLKPLIMGSNVA